MSTSDEGALDGTPWALAVDEEAGELHIEHAESGHSYVFDEEGNLRVPGDGDVDGPLHEVRDALAGALADGAETPQTSGGECTVACDEETGELRLASEEAITLDAPAIDVNADDGLNATAKTVSVDADETLDATARTVDVEADTDLSLTATTADVQATDLTLDGQGQTTVRSNRDLELSANAELTLTGTNRLRLDGSLIEASATGPMNLEGAIINLN